MHVLVRPAVIETGRPERNGREDGRGACREREAARLTGPPGVPRRDDSRPPSTASGHEEREAVPRRDEEGRDREDVRRDEGRPDEEGAARRAGRREEREDEARARERHEKAGPHEEEFQHKAPLAVPREAEVERRLVAREDEADLPREERERGAGLGADPRPRLSREVRRDLARGQRPPLLRLRDALRVGRLPADVRRDPGDRAVDPVRAGPVSHEEVQPAVRRDQDLLARDDQVARERAARRRWQCPRRMPLSPEPSKRISFEGERSVLSGPMRGGADSNGSGTARSPRRTEAHSAGSARAGRPQGLRPPTPSKKRCLP